MIRHAMLRIPPAEGRSSLLIIDETYTFTAAEFRRLVTLPSRSERARAAERERVARIAADLRTVQ